jgi:translation initiation factor 4G
MDNIIKHRGEKIPSRVRFLLQDVLDLRRNQWVPRREKAGPKTLDQIHKEAEREKTQAALLDTRTMGGGGGNRDRDRGGDRDNRGNNRGDDRGKRSSRGPQQSPEDEWSTVPNRSKNTEKIDALKIQNLASNRKEVGDITFGPGNRGGGFNSWGKGSGSAARPSSSQTKQPEMDSNRNRFAIMQQQPPPTSAGSDGGRRGYSQSMGAPARSNSRGSSTDERRNAVQAVRDINNGTVGAGSRPEASESRTLGSTANPPGSNQQVVGGPSVSMDGAEVPTTLPIPSTLSEAEMIAEQTKQLKGPRDQSEELLQRKAKSILSEYLENCDENEAFEGICEGFHPSTICSLAEHWINIVLDSKSTKDMRKTGKVLNLLVSKNALLLKQLIVAMESVLALADVLLVDVPKLFDILGQIIGE